MAEKIAYLFPGQGSQYVGMGASFYAEFALARSIFAEAEEVLGLPLRKYCFEGPLTELTKTRIAQPAILTVEYIIYRLLTEEGVAPTWVAGHSLGEYAALVAAGTLTFADALQLVQKRAEYMAAVPVDGAMAAVVNYPFAQLEAMVKELAADGIIELANFNSPTQIVVSGEKQLVEALVARITEEKVGRAIPLAVQGAFHSRIMEPAAKRFHDDLARTNFLPLKTPLISNVTAEEVTSPDELPSLLEKQIYSPVQWEATTRHLLASGCDLFLELGGKILSGLVKKTTAGAKVIYLMEAEDVKKYLQK
ncbi:MAG TPA: ACP S-malonyltransferase [Firmicutes bacterium]|nr:ACP S-malonyltransferase [Bacillota bacterium]